MTTVGEAMHYVLTRASGGMAKGDVVSRQGHLNMEASEVAVHVGSTGVLRLVEPGALRPADDDLALPDPEVPAWIPDPLTLAPTRDRFAVPFAVAAAGVLAFSLCLILLGVRA